MSAYTAILTGSPLKLMNKMSPRVLGDLIQVTQPVSETNLSQEPSHPSKSLTWHLVARLHSFFLFPIDRAWRELGSPLSLLSLPSLLCDLQ